LLRAAAFKCAAALPIGTQLSRRAAAALPPPGLLPSMTLSPAQRQTLNRTALAAVAALTLALALLAPVLQFASLTGVLIALPASAVALVALRRAHASYLLSQLFVGR
jgi:Zn-dependent membrane protease YugP